MKLFVDDFADIFTGRHRYEAADIEALIDAVPARACVALLVDRGGAPLQLICTKNLRAMLRRRLGSSDLPSESAALPSKRLDYRALVSGVAWRRVDSEFEMDLVYIEATRRAFPSHWRRLIPDRAAHFVRIDPGDVHPDFTRVTDPSNDGAATVFGPFPDRAKADRWIEFARDAFDLCRYRNILAQAPHGRACAYKQMGKCPAPCDGSIPLDVYRAGVINSVAALRTPAVLVAELGATMKAHAALLEFEQAGRVKGRLSTLAKLIEGASRSVRPIEAFNFVSVQPGPRKGTVKIFAMTASAIAEVACVIDVSDVALDAVIQSVDIALPPSDWPPEVLLGTICFHLAGAKGGHRFIARSAMTAASLGEMLSDSAKPRAAAPDDDGEAIRETRIEI